MTATIIDGNAIAQQIRDEVKREIDELKRHDVEPGLAFVLVGDNPASISYVRGKSKDAVEIGMRSDTIRLPEDTTQERLLSVLRELNADRRWHGVITDIIRNGQEQKEFPEGDPDEAALRLRALMDGMSILLVLRDTDMTPERMRDACIDYAAHLIGFEVPERAASAKS